ncbi:putative uncharacterized protein DDB_G0286901 [Teleopsis dalmanni]|uniref:putative uncharacterized protein DDB_G0286901 n=1 Tax=Teleopsis dalmanni TaxID=139649 RepID=UPI0018CFEC6E|nr:putative uncharacterized protein DDB_G0286901 [Teleopsis dalmanni]
MNSPHLVTAANTHHIHNQQQNAGLTNTNMKNFINTYNNMSNSNGLNNSSSNSNSNNSNNSATTNLASTNKFAPARRLAGARQTLRLAIPKQQGDTYSLQNPCNGTNAFYRHSPSQLPPAPILKRNTPSPATASVATYSHTPKSSSPLESHNLPNVTPTVLSGNNGSTIVTPSSCGSGKLLNLRKPNITLNSSDIRNNNDLFAFSKDLSPSVDMEHTPMFADIASSISPSSGSPTHHLNRLFNLSPSTKRSYGNCTPTTLVAASC